MWRWPARVALTRPDGMRLVLRPLERSDRAVWTRLRETNRGWLHRWESSLPSGPERDLPFRRLRRAYEDAARAGQVLPWAVEVDGRLVGQMHLFEITWGSRWSAAVGYWLGEASTGRGVATWALAMAVQHGIQEVGLHRVEINIRPENTASLAVVRRLGLPEEGLRRSLVHVDGAWRDHLTFVVTEEWLADHPLLGTDAAGRHWCVGDTP